MENTIIEKINPKKKWMQNNLEKCAELNRKYYDARKDDPEYMERIRNRARARRARIKAEKLLNNPPPPEKIESEIKEKKKPGRPRKYI
jgi:hypothetical protein